MKPDNSLVMKPDNSESGWYNYILDVTWQLITDVVTCSTSSPIGLNRGGGGGGGGGHHEYLREFSNLTIFAGNTQKVLNIIFESEKFMELSAQK